MANNGNGKSFTSQQSLDAAIWSVCDILRRSNCASALQYIPELTWLLFLRILDEREQYEAQKAEAVGLTFTPSLAPPYRWRDWADRQGPKRVELGYGELGAVMRFVNGTPQGNGDEQEKEKKKEMGLLPYLKSLRDLPNATPRQKVISEIMSGVERTRVDTEKNFLDVIDKINDIRSDAIDPTHIFTLSQVYEGLLLKMGEKNNDGGQFFTPREVIRAMVQAIDPQPGETIYDPCCGTGGFLAQSFDYLLHKLETSDNATPDHYETLRRRTFYGREKENLIYPIALANMVLHGIDTPHIWHGNTLTGGEIYGGLYQGAPPAFDIILTNPPFGGKEGVEAQTNFAYHTSATQVLFLQHVITTLRPGGRAGIVLDEGVLFRTNEKAFVQTKQKLLDDCDVWAIVSLPGGVFSTAGAGVKTNLLFFTKGQPTERIWYYDLSDIKVGKRTPLTKERFADFFRLLPDCADSERSWTVSIEQIRAKNYDLKAVNPNARREEDTRTPVELLDIIETHGKAVDAAVQQLRGLLA